MTLQSHFEKVFQANVYRQIKAKEWEVLLIKVWTAEQLKVKFISRDTFKTLTNIHGGAFHNND